MRDVLPEEIAQLFKQMRMFLAEAEMYKKQRDTLLAAAEMINAEHKDLVADAGPVSGKWQPIATAPRTSVSVLLFRHNACISGYWARKYWVTDLGQPIEPTHWMPKPMSPPEAEWQR